MKQWIKRLGIVIILGLVIIWKYNPDLFSIDENIDVSELSIDELHKLADKGHKKATLRLGLFYYAADMRYQSKMYFEAYLKKEKDFEKKRPVLFLLDDLENKNRDETDDLKRAIDDLESTLHMNMLLND